MVKELRIAKAALTQTVGRVRLYSYHSLKQTENQKIVCSLAGQETGKIDLN
jgi:hypothetical protein